MARCDIRKCLADVAQCCRTPELLAPRSEAPPSRAPPSSRCHRNSKLSGPSSNRNPATTYQQYDEHHLHSVVDQVEHPICFVWPHQRNILRVLVEQTPDLGSQHRGFERKHCCQLLILQPKRCVVDAQGTHPQRGSNNELIWLDTITRIMHTRIVIVELTVFWKCFAAFFSWKNRKIIIMNMITPSANGT